MEAKWKLIKEIFSKKAKEILADENLQQFIGAESEWLVPYAVFCYLRDKNQTADFSQWKDHNVYHQEEINQLIDPDSESYLEIAIHYFVQYHLHIQLVEAVEYSHSKGIALKGDIPIGIYRHSADAWYDPELYFMDMQAGAPPDDFSRKGQNWGFPTYNWDRMAEDGYDWWKKRFSQLSNYFDSFRIDHILGFFRIWQVPMNSVEALMGVFEPSLPININEFSRWNISFDYDRFCKPFINDEVLYRLFRDQTESVKLSFLQQDQEGNWSFKPEFDTQRKLETHFEKSAPLSEENAELLDKLYELISNVLFLEIEGSNRTAFHPRCIFQYTLSYQLLPSYLKERLMSLYNHFYYERHEEFWKGKGMEKLPAMKLATNMLICGEDLGMVPQSVPEVMEDLGILSLEVQRMPKIPGQTFSHPKDSPYLSVVTPSSHDTSTIRGWWEEDRNRTQEFYNSMLGAFGEAPQECTPDIVSAIVNQHLYSPAMWAIFPIQDFLGMDANLRNPDVQIERINIPAIIPHYWNYRMHIDMDKLIEEDDFNERLKALIGQTGR
ncbi:MAG: 4-alpha-glucanotransferase [Bacteroidota bacterium]